MGTGTVTVRVTVSGDRDITVTPTSMTFTGSNWDTAQMVTVTAARDDDAVTDTAELRHTASGADYGGVRALPLPVAVTDTSVRGVLISVATLEFREGGRGRYTVVLETKPTGTVTVRPSLAAGSDSDVTVSPSALSFTTSSWRTPKTVTVSARQDIDTTADNATITHAVTGADYGDAGVTAAAVSVMVTDDDIASTAITLALSTTIGAREHEPDADYGDGGVERLGDGECRPRDPGPGGRFGRGGGGRGLRGDRAGDADHPGGADERPRRG